MFGWYVETDSKDPQDGIFIGDSIAVDSEGTLRVFGDADDNRTFTKGTWKFVFPRLALLGDVPGRPGLYEVGVLPSPNERDIPTKQVEVIPDSVERRHKTLTEETER